MNMNERIRNHIISNGLKFSFVADRAEIDIKKFSRMMNNKQKISTDEYESICQKGLYVSPTHFYEKKFLETKNSA